MCVSYVTANNRDCTRRTLDGVAFGRQGDLRVPLAA
jgi:hypothetical protein